MLFFKLQELVVEKILQIAIKNRRLGWWAMIKQDGGYISGYPDYKYFRHKGIV